MKAYSVSWTNGIELHGDGPETDELYKWGDVTVVADSLTKAIARFQKEYHPTRVIEAVKVNTDEALVDEYDLK
jgi:hypothetical protein